MASSAYPYQELLRSPRGRIVPLQGEPSHLPKLRNDVIDHEKETPSKRRLTRHVVDSQNQSSPGLASTPISQPGPTPEVKSTNFPRGEVNKLK
ncbi:hypothetical protein Ndes2526B_g04602 [Nannochloris sp. 'desiccata']|nr:hypothetical protein KSW81_000667 [Chlorella desiccata (nom. nud.)]KAH7620683.1 hypothetical protein NADE_003297 [Chlorella desiccata (nom. nud.)]